MDLNNISLQPCLLAELYQNVLVQEAAITKPLTYLGKNLKKVLILVSTDDARFLPDKELEFLTSILSACKLGLNDVAVVNTRFAEGDFDTVVEQLQPTTSLFFDVDAGFLPDAFEKEVNQAHTVNHIRFVKAASLSDLASKVEEKRKLWAALKHVFSI